jgi:hypothetical protein
MLRIWRFLTLLLVALSLGMAFCHALELVPKMRYGAALYLTLQRTLYLLFGAPVGASIEVGAVASTIVLVVLVRHRRPAFALTLAAAICMTAAHAAWWIWVNPANAVLMHMQVHAPAADWTRWRDQWEYTHLARFFLQLIAFGALLVSLVAETPE